MEVKVLQQGKGPVWAMSVQLGQMLFKPACRTTTLMSCAVQVQANGGAALQRIDNRFYALEAAVKALESKLLQQSQTLSGAVSEDFQGVMTILRVSYSLLHILSSQPPLQSLAIPAECYHTTSTSRSCGASPCTGTPVHGLAEGSTLQCLVQHGSVDNAVT